MSSLLPFAPESDDPSIWSVRFEKRPQSVYRSFLALGRTILLSRSCPFDSQLPVLPFGLSHSLDLYTCLRLVPTDVLQSGVQYN